MSVTRGCARVSALVAAGAAPRAGVVGAAAGAPRVITDQRRALLLHAVARSTIDAGEEVELRIKSDDTSHGFRIVGTRHERRRSRSAARARSSVVVRRSTSRAATRSSAAGCAAPATTSCEASWSCASARRQSTADDAARASVAGGGAALDRGVAALARRSAGRRATLQPGDPLPGLTPQEFAEFRLGLDDFTEVETAEEGLGPAFNGTSCAVCHSVPAIGGGGVMLETRAGYRDADGAFRGLNAAGDTLIHLFSMPTHGCQPLIPDDVNVIARRAPIPLFGAGLVEAIPDDTLLALEDPLDRNRDGVSGRAAIDRRRRRPAIGASAGSAGRRSTRRCSRSAPTPIATRWASPTISSRARSAHRHHRRADAPLRSASRIRKTRASRSTGRRGHRQLRVVHAVPRAGRRAATSDEATRDGERLFARDRLRGLSRAGARRPAPSANPLFDRRPVPLFSDLLLHDVGTGDGIAQGAARARGDPHAGAVGAAAAPAAAARRQRGDDRRRDRAAPERSRTRPPRLRVALRGRAESADRVSSIDLTWNQGSGFKVQGSRFAVHMVPWFTRFRAPTAGTSL